MLEPASFAYRALQAAALTLLGLTERAVPILAVLVGEFPNNEVGWLYYGHALRGSGRVIEAIEAYRRSIELKPGFGEAWFSLADLKTFRFSAADVGAMGAQLARTDLGDDDRLHFEFSLGKAFEDAGDFADSFAHYVRGNALRRAAVQYDPDRTSKLVERTQALFTREFFAARARQTPVPVGHGGQVPRSHPTSTDVGRALRMARKLQFGTVWINAHIPLVNEMPHGGYKQSGYGKDMSIYSLEEYTQIKHVMASLD